MLDVKLKLIPGHTSERVWMAASPLRTLFWNATYACNYHCSICFANADTPSSEELTTREAMEMFTNAQREGVKNLIISGGEPFMRKDIVSILSHTAKLGLEARIASNGSLLSEEILKQLKNETLTKSFQISLDTLDPGLYSKFHGVSSDTLKDVLNSLRTIKAYDFHTTVSARLTPQTLPTIPQLLDRACDEGWATVTIHIPLLTGRNGEAFPQNSDFLTLLEPAFEHFLALPKRWLTEMFIPWAQYHRLVKRLRKKIKVVYAGCRAGRDRLTINPCGDISLCVCFDVPEFYLGNIRRDNLNDIFHGSRMCDMMRHPHKYDICGDCPNVMTCGGGCRVAAYAVTGRIDGRDGSCLMYNHGENRRSKVSDAT
ncbi:MAG: radical SAM protein [Candidatus Aminicenantes bacterium]|nr:MAG: radical SAM protein [Candidatus Aminicenantes bacterium]